MRIFKSLLMTLSVLLFLLGGGRVFWNISSKLGISHLIPVPFAFADEEDEDEEEDEEEDEDEDEEDEDDEDDAYEAPAATEATPTTKTQTTVQRVIEYRPVTRSVVVTESGYDVDADGDGLVDALDPDPKRHQSEYFTDTDGDAVPNALDLHPGEDDFIFVEGAADENNNGIIDTYEVL